MNVATKKALVAPTMNTLLFRIRKMLIAVDTKWNSSFDVVRPYLDQHLAIALTLVSPATRKDHKDIDTLTYNDIYNAECVMSFLS